MAPRNWWTVLLLVGFCAPALAVLNDRLIKWITSGMPFFHCTNAVIVFDQNYAGNEEFDSLLIALSRPMTLLESVNGDVPSLRSSFFKPRHKDKYCSVLIILNDKVEEQIRLFQLMEEYFFVSHTLMVCEVSFKQAQTLLHRLKNEQIHLVTGSTTKSSLRYEVFFWHINGEVEMVEMTPGYTWREDLEMNLRGSHLTVATLNYPPLSMVKVEKGEIQMSGIEHSVFKTLAESLNATVGYVLAAPDELWGEIKANGTVLTGLLGMLWRREVDMVVGSLYIHHARLKYISYVTPYKMDFECFMCTAPGPYPKWMSFYLPMTTNVWLLILFSLVVAVLLLYVVARTSMTKSNFDDRFESLGVCTIFIVGNFLQVQQPHSIKRTTNRGFLFFWLLGAFVVVTVYRTELISFMTVPINPKPINTLEQLGQANWMRKTTFGDFFKNILLKSPDPIQNLLGQQLIVNYNLSWAYEQIEKPGGTCSLNSLDDVKYMAATRFKPKSDGKKRVHIMDECMLPDLLAFGLQIKSPLKPYMDKRVNLMVQAGFFEYENRRFIHKIKFGNNIQHVPFTIAELESAWLLYGVGIVLATLVFIYERLHPPQSTRTRTFLP